jgi:hypothetical protein
MVPPPPSPSMMPTVPNAPPAPPPPPQAPARFSPTDVRAVHDAVVAEQERARRNYPRGAILGLLAGAIGGAAWYGITVGTESQYVYLAFLLGALVGITTSIGARGRGPVVAALAAAVSLVVTVGSYYFIDRHFIMEAGGDLPLIGSFTQIREVLSTGYDVESSQYLFTLLSVGAAGFFGFKGR